MAVFKASPEKRSQPRPLTRPRRNPPPAAWLTERSRFLRSKSKGGDHGDRTPNRRRDSAEASSLINPFDPSFWRDPYSHYPCLLAGPPRLLPLLLPTVLVARHCDDRFYHYHFA